MTRQLNPFRMRETTVSAGGATEDVVTKVVPPATTLIVQHIATLDEDNSVTQVRLIVDDRGLEYPIEEKESLGADDVYSYQHVIYLNEGERLVARFTGSTDGDYLRLFVSGMERVVDTGRAED